MKSKTTLTLFLVLIAGMGFGQRKANWSSWQSIDCYTGIQYSVVLLRNSTGSYWWNIRFKNNYDEKVSFNARMTIGSNGEGTGGLGIGSIQPGAVYTYTDFPVKTSSTSYSVVIDKICFAGYGFCSDTTPGKCYATCSNNSVTKHPTCGNVKNSSNSPTQSSNSQNQNSNATQVNSNDFQGLISELNSSCQKLGMVMNLNTGSSVYNSYCKTGKTYEQTVSNTNYLKKIISEIKTETAKFDKEYGDYQQQQTAQQDQFAAAREQMRQQEEARQRENERQGNFQRLAKQANEANNAGRYDEAISLYEELQQYAANNEERNEIQGRIDGIKKIKRSEETIQTLRETVIPALQAIEDARTEKRKKEKEEYEKKKRENAIKEAARKEAAVESAKSTNLSYLEDENFLNFFSFGLNVLKEANLDGEITKFLPQFADNSKGVYAVFGDNDSSLQLLFNDMILQGVPHFTKRIVLSTRSSNSANLRKAINSSSVSNIAKFRTDQDRFQVDISFSDGSYTEKIPKQNSENAIKIFEDNIKKNNQTIKEDGSNDSYKKLGRDYNLGGNGQKADQEKAIYNYSKCANNGDSECMYYLGTIYKNKYAKETFVSKNYNDQSNNVTLKLSNEWFRKAAVEGSALSAFALAVSYELGMGTEKNLYKMNYYAELAQKLFAKECAAGNKESCKSEKAVRYSGSSYTDNLKFDFGSKPQGRPVVIFFDLKKDIQSFVAENNNFEIKLENPTTLKASLKEEFKGKSDFKIQVILSNGSKKEIKIKGEVTDFVPFKDFEK